MRLDLRGCALAILAALLTLMVLEGVASLWSAYRWAKIESRPDLPLFILRDPALGWRATPNRNLSLDADGRRFTTDHRGWRRYDVPPSQPLVLVVGDSFTHAVGVADGAVYYDVIACRLGLAIVALGVNGYGTVQEFLLAREMARGLPRPAAILLQMSDNDVINNSYALEWESFVNNNLLPRPYVEDAGDVTIRDPRRLHEWFTLGRELTRRVLTGRVRTIESAIEAGDSNTLDLYVRELGHTARSLRLLREVFPDAAAFAFNVGASRSRVGRDLERLAREARFDYVDIGPRFSMEARQSNVVQADGVHWNAVGHSIAGSVLTELLAGELRVAPRAGTCPELKPAR